MQFKRFFSLDSPKAIKARSYGYLNAINYMAPANTAGVGNLCPHASPGCLKLCLGWYSGQAGMVSHQNKLNDVRRSRQAKARMFMTDRKAFLEELRWGVRAAGRAAIRQGLKLCVRLNGATDVAWEGVAPELFRDFFDVQFVDYTKSVKRALAHARGELPPNYHLDVQPHRKQTRRIANGFSRPAAMSLLCSRANSLKPISIRSLSMATSMTCVTWISNDRASRQRAVW